MLMAGERVEGEAPLLLPSPSIPPCPPTPRPSLHLLLRLVPTCEQEVTSRKKQSQHADKVRWEDEVGLVSDESGARKEIIPPPRLHGKNCERGTLAPGGVVGILPDCVETTGISETKATTEKFTEIPCDQEMSKELRAP